MDQIKKLFSDYGYLRYWKQAIKESSSVGIDTFWKTFIYLEKSDNLKEFIEKLLFEHGFADESVYEDYFDADGFQGEYEDHETLLSFALEFFPDIKISESAFKENPKVYARLFQRGNFDFDIQRFENPQLVARYIDWFSVFYFQRIGTALFKENIRNSLYLDCEKQLFLKDNDNENYTPLLDDEFVFLLGLGIVFSDDLFASIFESEEYTICTPTLRNFLIDLMNLPDNLMDSELMEFIDELLENDYIGHGFNEGYGSVLPLGLVKLHKYILNNEFLLDIIKSAKYTDFTEQIN